MSEQALKFGVIVDNKKEFHASKQSIALNLVKTNKIVTSDRFKHSHDGSKSSQMSGYIKHFDNGGKNIFKFINMHLKK